MIQNFTSLLLAVNAAKNRSQLEHAYNTAGTMLDVWLNANAINSVDYHTKHAQLNDAYHKQLVDFTHAPIAEFLGQLHEKACGEVKS